MMVSCFLGFLPFLKNQGGLKNLTRGPILNGEPAADRKSSQSRRQSFEATELVFTLGEKKN